MGVLEEVILEETNKTWYAVISSKTWGSIWGSFVTGGIAWGIINRSTSAVVSPTLKEAVIRWIKQNNFIKNVNISGNNIEVDQDWWNREKNTEIILLQAPEKSTFKGVFSDRNVSGPYTQHGGVIIGGGAVVPKATKENFAKMTGIKSSTMTIETVIKKSGLKIKTGDTGIDITGPVNAFKKFNGWESLDMYTEREVRELLEQAFSEGYDNGIDDTLDYIDENYEIDEDFDLEDEYEYYTESNAAKKAANRETFMKNTTPYNSGRTAREGKGSHSGHLYDNRGREYSGTKAADDMPDDVRHSYLKQAIHHAKSYGDSAGARMNLAAAPTKSYHKYKKLYDKAIENGKKPWGERPEIKKMLGL